LEKFDAVVFVEFPGEKNTYLQRLLKNKLHNLYLIIYESPVIKPDNLTSQNHHYFRKIFTWDDTAVDNKKYFKINYAHKMPRRISQETSHKKKLCTLIASNKFTAHPRELYSERIKAIRWFEQHRPEDFDLYGIGWDRHYFHGTWLGMNLARLNRLTPLAKLLKPQYPSYRGVVPSKRATHQHYRFAICYENAKDFSGYITEKIFDCFFAGCVPVYRGADNITQHIPENTFIDKRQFPTYEELYAYIKNMPEEEYRAYLRAIQSFLASDKAYPFSAEYFAKTLIHHITS